MENIFTANIKSILEKHYKKNAEEIFEKSQLLQYINEKTRSANNDAKSRQNIGNLYALYVLIKDYKNANYKSKGAKVTELIKEARKLPFGSKFQNHSFDNRLNDEFKNKTTSHAGPILKKNKKVFLNQDIVRIKIGKNSVKDISDVVLEIIDKYIEIKRKDFLKFIKKCKELQNESKHKKAQSFIINLLTKSDSRRFEIVTFSILKYYYKSQKIFYGENKENIIETNLELYKTGRTNANDGGIDFVMKPLGRFFQVTETLDFKKYFLDIDKIQKYPVSFVIKSTEPTTKLRKKIHENATKTYSINAIVDNYMGCIEEIINIPTLLERFKSAIKQKYLSKILDEIITQSKVEFNYDEMDEK